jgi:hypothetical protein
MLYLDKGHSAHCAKRRLSWEKLWQVRICLEMLFNTDNLTTRNVLFAREFSIFSFATFDVRLGIPTNDIFIQFPEPNSGIFT